MTTLADFEFEDVKVIGRGQYGKAHLVRSAKDQQLFVAKTIDLTCLSAKERETSLQEVTLLRRLEHPNIVNYKDSFFMGDTLVIIMEHCEGGDLATYIKDMARRKMKLREAQVMKYFAQALHALQYIHQERILHRDLKTSNFFLMKRKTLLKVGDFGISRVLEGSVQAAITVVGTPYYMSPEVCENKPYTFKSDVWALGCVLYELCQLKHAFSADNLLGLVYKIVSDKYEPIPRLYSQALNTLIQRTLEKNADKRPSVHDLIADPYVQSFMNEYTRMRTRCSVTQREGMASTMRQAGTTLSGAGRSSPATSTMGAGGKAWGGGGPGATNGRRRDPAATGGERPARPRPARPGGRGGGAKHETLREAAQRRKREAADRKGEELKAAAAKKAAQGQATAQRLKQQEFEPSPQSAEAPAEPGEAAPVSPPASPANSSTESTAVEEPTPKPNEAWPLQAQEPAAEDSFDADESASLSSDDEPEAGEAPLEEISEAMSSAEEYEDDFEEDFCSVAEEVDECSEIEDLEVGSVELGGLPVVREEEEYTRLMSHCEPDLPRPRTVVSPPLRRCSSPPRRISGERVVGPLVGTMPGAVPLAATAGLGSTTAGTGQAFTGTTGLGSTTGAAGPAPGGPVMDMRSRAARLHEDLVRKMGAETFKKAFDFLYQARERNSDQRMVRRELEALVGRDNYKTYAFDVDQLVFQRMLYS